MENRGHVYRTPRPFRRALSMVGAGSVACLATIMITVAGCSDSGGEPELGPAVVSVSPQDGATAVSVNGTIVVSFTKSLDGASLIDGVVLEDNGRELRGFIASQDASTIAFVPSDPLDFGTTYGVTVRASIKDRDGRPIEGTYSWTFQTEGSPPPALNRDSVRSYIRVLASDSLRGREAGTADELRAAQYLASRFGDWGLGPLLADMIQPFHAETRNGIPIDSRNVLAVVAGEGSLANEWVVVGAHYDAQGTIIDSLGIERVRNGADDNASGTAMVLELARLYSRHVSLGGTAGVPRRTVLFAGFGAEEVGLIGSCEFVEANVVASSQMAAMMNYDMVGRLRDNTVRAQSRGSTVAWDNMLANTNVRGLFIDPNDACRYNCSDFACFANREVPYVWFYTGTHAQYHRPEDDEPLINYDGMIAIGDMSFRILSRLVVAPGNPVSGQVAAFPVEASGR